MAIRLHTRVADDIRAACTHNGVLDTVQQSEMRMESPEYAAEVRGQYDEEYDPYDRDDDRDCEPDGDQCEECGCICEDGTCPNSNCPTNDGDDATSGPEDFGWDGGMEA